MTAREPSCRQCRLNALGQWIGWHLLELTAVGVPLALTLAVSVWWLVLAVPAGAWWIAHEIHQARSSTDPTPGRAVTSAPQQRAVTATSDSAPSPSDSTSNASESSKEASA